MYIGISVNPSPSYMHTYTCIYTCTFLWMWKCHYMTTHGTQERLSTKCVYSKTRHNTNPKSTHSVLWVCCTCVLVLCIPAFYAYMLHILCQFLCFRFESTIVGQFFGHTHHDTLEIFYDTQNTSRATKWVARVLSLPSRSPSSSPRLSPSPYVQCCLHQSQCDHLPVC